MTAADEGITGTSTEKRDDFQRMMADCRRGLIDQILVKSISRFARNTKECLENVRELKELGVNVRFERESINTANVSSELITAIYAAFAQKESESISGNMRWSYQRRMESGTFLPSAMAYGYKIVDKKIEIEPDAALVVCRIFQWYLDGISKDLIAKRLNEEGIPTTQNKIWRNSGVHYILTNERYIGDSLWQKSYTTDLLRGQAFEIEGYTFFTMGGALSHDIADGILDPYADDFEEQYWFMRRMRCRFRVNHYSWWKEELPSDEEYAEALKTLERIGWAADYIITHCAPNRVVKKLNPNYTLDRLTIFLEKIRRKAKFHYWLFAHYHDNKIIDERYVLLWEQIVQII